MVVKELITLLGFEIEDEKLKKFDEAIDQTKKGLAILGTTVVATGVSLFALTKTAANTADEIRRLSFVSGVSSEDLQTLGYAASVSGANINFMSMGLRDLSKSLDEVRLNASGEKAKMFRSLGVQVFDLNGNLRSSADVLLDMSKAFQNIQNPTQRTAIAMRLMGESGGNLVELLDKGPETIRALQDEIRGIGILTDEQIDSLKNFNDGWERVSSTLLFIKNLVAAEISPVMTALLDDVKDFIQANKEVIKTGLLDFFMSLAKFLKVVWIVTRGVGQIFVWLTDKIGGVAFVTKTLLTFLTLLGSGMVIAGLLTVTKLVIGLGSAFLIASAKAIAIGVAIAAAVAAITLVVEDLFTFFSDGGESYTGDLVNWLGDKFNEFSEYTKEKLKELEQWLLMWFDKAGKAISYVVLWPIKQMADGLDWIFKKLGLISKNAPSIPDLDKMIYGNGSFTGRTPAPSNTTNNNGGNVSLNAPITVTVPPGTDPSQVGESVERGVANGFQEMLRQTRRYTSPAGAY